MEKRYCGRASSIYWLIPFYVLFASSLSAQTKPSSERQVLLSQFSDSLDELAARVSPAIVQVQVTGYGPLEEEKGKSDKSQIARQRSLGSGVIVDPDGYIITNAHVVKGALRVRVLLNPPAVGDSQVPGNPGIDVHIQIYEAHIVGVAPTIDLALLKIEAKGLPTLPFADYAKVKQGQLVLAFGNPEGLENTVTMGIVSSVARQADPNVPSVYIQTDAPINPGNSGGPLVNTNGELVGINTFILSESGGSQGLGFAIPSSIVGFVYQQLREHGRVHRSIIGVQMQEITPTLAAGLHLQAQEGTLICDVLPGGPAEKAGVQIQDILLSLNGRRIGSVPVAQMLISMTVPEGTVHAEILRGTEKLMLSIPVVEQKDQVEDLADLMDPNKSFVTKLGIFGVEIDKKLADELEDLRVPSGVIVAAVSTDTLGLELDLQAGDVIHTLNSKKIETLDGLRAALNAIPAGGAVVLQVERESKLMYTTFEMD